MVFLLTVLAPPTLILSWIPFHFIQTYQCQLAPLTTESGFQPFFMIFAYTFKSMTAFSYNLRRLEDVWKV